MHMAYVPAYNHAVQLVQLTKNLKAALRVSIPSLPRTVGRQWPSVNGRVIPQRSRHPLGQVQYVDQSANCKKGEIWVPRVQLVTQSIDLSMPERAYQQEAITAAGVTEHWGHWGQTA